MSHPLAFNRINRRMILLLVVCHLVWCFAELGLWSVSSLVVSSHPWWHVLLIAFQLYTAAQLLLPVLLLHPEQRNRSFYLFWGIALALLVWAVNQVTVGDYWRPMLDVVRSSLLLMVASIAGAAMARYVKRLWEVVPVCLVMTLADFASLLGGPTAGFTEQIRDYYLSPGGAPPLVDMLLVKMVYAGQVGLAPVFGVSDWIMVVFFAIVARHHDVNDNLFGTSGEILARKGQIGRYLPVPVVALLVAIAFAQWTGLFIPALPVIALIQLSWYAGRYFFRRNT